MKKYIHILVTLSILFFTSSCNGKKYVFPTSNVTPGAKIEVQVSHDKFDNSVLNLTTQYLSDPERLSPPQKVYIIWVETKDAGVMNIGTIKTSSGKKTSLRMFTPFIPKEVFINAEDTPLKKFPSGIEIARIKVE